MKRPVCITQVLEAAAGVPPEKWTPSPSEGILQVTVKVPVMPVVYRGKVVGQQVMGRTEVGYKTEGDPE